MARMIGPIAEVSPVDDDDVVEIVKLLVSSISSRQRIWHVQMAIENWPMGGCRTDTRRMKTGRSRKYRAPWTFA
jgi:hypothetical protein